MHSGLTELKRQQVTSEWCIAVSASRARAVSIARADRAVATTNCGPVFLARSKAAKRVLRAAQEFFLSHRTVDHHLSSVFNKLGVDTRAQAVAVATREGVV